jgi:hypothetical protein
VSGQVITDFSKFLTVTGPEHGDIAWWLAQRNWEDAGDDLTRDQHVDAFLTGLRS